MRAISLVHTDHARLQEIMRTFGPGVYFVSCCRVLECPEEGNEWIVNSKGVRPVHSNAANCVRRARGVQRLYDDCIARATA